MTTIRTLGQLKAHDAVFLTRNGIRTEAEFVRRTTIEPLKKKAALFETAFERQTVLQEELNGGWVKIELDK